MVVLGEFIGVGIHSAPLMLSVLALLASELESTALSCSNST